MQHLGTPPLHSPRPAGLLALLLIGVTLLACGDGGIGPEPETVHTLVPLNSSVQAYHRLVLRLPAGLKTAGGTLPGVIDADTVWLEVQGDTLLSGTLPDVGAGARTVRVRFSENAVGEGSFNAVAPPGVQDPAAALAAVSTALDAAIDELAAGADPSSAATVATLAQEIQVELASLTDAERVEVAAVLASYPAELAALGLTANAFLMSGEGKSAYAAMPTLAEIRADLRAGIRETVDAVREVGDLGDLLEAGWSRLTDGFGWLATYLGFDKLKAQWEEIEFFPFKPGPRYNDLLASLQTGVVAPSGMAVDPTSTTHAASGPFSFASGSALTLQVTHVYESLRFEDQAAAAGETADLLQQLDQAQTWWAATRSLLQATATTLGISISLPSLTLSAQRARATYLVSASALTLGTPDNSAVACTAEGRLWLVLACSNSTREPQSFTVAASYPSDFGPQTVEIEGVVAPACWDAAGEFPGRWKLHFGPPFVDGNGEIRFTAHAGGGWTLDGINRDPNAWGGGTWSYDCTSGQLLIVGTSGYTDGYTWPVTVDPLDPYPLSGFDAWNTPFTLFRR